MTHPQDGCLGMLVCPVLQLCHHTCLCLHLRLPALRHMRCWVGPDGGEMGVEVLHHAINPVADVPFTQSRTRLHWQSYGFAQNRSGFMGTLNITAIEHGWT